MRFMGWIRGLGRGNSAEQTDIIKPGTFVPLLHSDGQQQGAMLVHAPETQRSFLSHLAAQNAVGQCGHNGNISGMVADQISGMAATVATTLQAGQLVQVVASPAIAEGLRTQAYTLMQTATGATGDVLGGGGIVGKLRFAPASVAPIVAPLVVWQVLHAVAGVRQLQRINARLDTLQRGIERLTFRQQAGTYGRIAASIESIAELDRQYRAIGRFTDDMRVRLAIASRDISTSLLEQRLLLQRFEQLKERVVASTSGKKGAFEANQLLKEEMPEFMLDANLYVAASKASLAANQAWIVHDIEHVPDYLATRMTDLAGEVESIEDALRPMASIKELQDHATECLNEMSWVRRSLNPTLKKEVRGRDAAMAKQEDQQQWQETSRMSSVVIWREPNGVTRSVALDLVPD